MEIETCIKAFSNLKPCYFANLSTISKSQQGTILCNETNFLVLNLEKIEEKSQKLVVVWQMGYGLIKNWG